MTVIVAYTPWEIMSNREKDVCVAESVLGWQRVIDLDRGTIRWIKKSQYDERMSPTDFPPRYSTDPKALDEIKRKFDMWHVVKCGSRDYQVSVTDADGHTSMATSVTESDAFMLAAVRLCGAVV